MTRIPEEEFLNNTFEDRDNVGGAEQTEQSLGSSSTDSCEASDTAIGPECPIYEYDAGVKRSQLTLVTC